MSLDLTVSTSKKRLWLEVCAPHQCCHEDQVSSPSTIEKNTVVKFKGTDRVTFEFFFQQFVYKPVSSFSEGWQNVHSVPES